MWKFSSFSLLVDGSRDNFLIHNSFMGAVVDVPRAAIFHRDVADQLRNKFRPSEIFVREDFATREIIELLLRNGLIVKSGEQEREKAIAILEKEEDAAYHLIILPHEDCNFRCTYCYETFERGKMPPHVVEGTKRGIENALRGENKLAQLNISWFGGEPCLALDVVDDISQYAQKLCKKDGVRYIASMTTNGYFLKEATLVRLLANGVTHFQVTLDGTKETHNKSRMLRGKQGTFDVIYRNLLSAADSNHRVSFTIRVNVSQENYSGVVELISLLAPDFAEDSRFSLDFHSVGQWGGPNDENLPVFAEDRGHAAINTLIEIARAAGFDNKPSKRTLCSHGSVCYAGKRNSLVVGSDGTLYKCTVAFTDKRNKVGLVDRQKGFVTSPRKIAPWIKGSENSTKCKSCSFMAACRGKSCPLESLENIEPVCPKTQQQLIELIQVSASADGMT